MNSTAVVFAYHNVGVRCLSVLIDLGVQIQLVITHQDNPNENIWFESVEALARIHGIPVLIDPNVESNEFHSTLKQLKPDFLFSFYYRSMLLESILNIPIRGAFNMHGSLLPKYRGRVPVNWAIINGETETGATLHQMVQKPDAGAIVDQQSVPILENDTALDVFNKVTVSAEIVLRRSLPQLIDGTAKLNPQTLSQGSYFGGRRPEDGVIDWRQKSIDIHNLVRAVAPPYPGAWTNIAGKPACIMRTLLEKQKKARFDSPSLYVEKENLYADCIDGHVLRILALQIEGKTLLPTDFQTQFGLTVALI